MKAEIVNCFVEALKSTMLANGGFKLVDTNQNAIDVVHLDSKVGIIIEVFGSSTIQGKVVVTMDEEIAHSIVGFMLGGTKVDLIDSIGISALGEYTNWITSSAAKQVENYGEMISNFRFDVIPPNSKEGDESKVYPPNGFSFISLSYTIDSYELVLSVAV